MSQKEANFIYDKIKHLDNPLGVEVGVADGSTAIPLLQKHKGLNLYCVDPYVMYEATYSDGKAKQHGFITQSQFDAQFQNTRFKLEQKAGTRVTLIRLGSEEVAFHFSDELFDFVFIDGNHLYKSVVNDIQSWVPKVAWGGVMIGHDYNPADPNLKANVVKAVDESFTKINRGPGSIWWVEKDQ